MNFYRLREYVLHRLEQELDGRMHYHCLGHTIDVMDAAERIARSENMDDHQVMLLKTAALMHDFGMINTFVDHEAVSVRLAAEILPEYDYSNADIEVVSSIIMATVVNRKPENEYERIICDADLDYLGRADYFVIAQKLRQEWLLLEGKIFEEKEWYLYQLDFLEKHQFYTHSSKKLNEGIKQENIRQLRKMLSSETSCEK